MENSQKRRTVPLFQKIFNCMQIPAEQVLTLVSLPPLPVVGNL